MEAVRPQNQPLLEKNAGFIYEPPIPEPLKLEPQELKRGNTLGIKISDELDELEQMMMENQYMEELQQSIMEQPQENVDISKINDIREKYQVKYPSLAEPNVPQQQEQQYIQVPNTHQELVQKAKQQIQELREQTKQMQNDVKVSLFESEEQQDEEIKQKLIQIEDSIIRQSVQVRNQELKQKLLQTQDTLLKFIPKEQQEIFKLVNMKNRVVELPKKLENVTPSEKVLELAAQNIEIRSVIESDNQYGLVPVVKEYIVHKVDAKKDTLFQLSYRYKVPKNVIQRVNKFSGEDIYYMKEILIPYTGQQIIQKQEHSDQEKLEQHRALNINFLAETIKQIEKQKAESIGSNNMLQNSNIPKSDFKAEAKYYLEQNGYDHKKAVDNYKKDLEFEYKTLYGKNYNKSVSSGDSEVGVRGNKKKCEIF